MEKKDTITEALRLIFEGIDLLRSAFPERRFTIDGRLAGDIGDVIGELAYDVDLFNLPREGHDGRTSDGRLVQVQATFKDSLTFRTTPEYYLGLKLHQDGTHEEVFNGPGNLIHERYKHRKGIGTTQLSFPNSELRKLSDAVPKDERITKRKN